MEFADEDIARFHDSLDRALACGHFLDSFYDGFVDSSEEIREIFRNSDMGRLKRKLKSSLHMMTMLVDNEPGVGMYMGHLARVHDRYQITPAHFQAWLDSLIAAVSNCDPQFTPELEEIWRGVIGRGIAIMVEGADAPVLED